MHRIRRRSWIAAACLVALALSSAAVAAEAGRWSRLGTRTVTDRVERDAIPVGRDRGRFEALRIDARRSPVHVRQVVVRFENGETQTIDRDIRVGRGGSSPVLDLDGGSRFVDEVVLTYDAASLGRGRATVELWGRH